MINMGTGVDSDKLKPKIIEKLLNAEAKIDLANNEGNTALHEAVIGNNLLLLQFLTEQNANTTIQNYKKRRPSTKPSSTKNGRL